MLARIPKPAFASVRVISSGNARRSGSGRGTAPGRYHLAAGSAKKTQKPSKLGYPKVRQARHNQKTRDNRDRAWSRLTQTAPGVLIVRKAQVTPPARLGQRRHQTGQTVGKSRHQTAITAQQTVTKRR
jgi:hypothetical protein